MTLKKRVENLEQQAEPEDRLPSLEESLKAAQARHRAGIVREWSASDETPRMAAARARVERMQAEQGAP